MPVASADSKSLFVCGPNIAAPAFAVIDPLRKSEGVRRALRGLIYGRQANYYYGKEEKKAG